MKRIATALALATATCAPTDAPPGPAPSTTVAPPNPHPPSTTAPTTPTLPTTGPPPVAAPPVATTAALPPPVQAVGAGAAEHIARASWYARGARTASGEAFDPDGLTAAHRTLPFGTRLHVCHAGRCVEVRVNDRGPAVWTGRELDLSRAAFAAIAPLSRGVVTVTWEAA